MPHKDTIEGLEEELALILGFAPEGTLKYERAELIKKLLQKSFHAGLQRGVEEKQELIEALEMMYDQYCAAGHQFMSAGENAQIVLQKHGFDTDMAGRITSRPAITKEAENK